MVDVGSSTRGETCCQVHRLLDLTPLMYTPRGLVAALRKLCRESMLDMNKRLFVQNWRCLSPLSVHGTGKEQRPPKQTSDALRFLNSALKLPATNSVSEP